MLASSPNGRQERSVNEAPLLGEALISASEVRFGLAAVADRRLNQDASSW